MRACIFVDGENFRHSIVDLFQPEFDEGEYLPKTANWEQFFDFVAGRCYDSTRLRTYWYVVQEIDFRPFGLRKLDPEKRVEILSRNRSARSELQAAANRDAKTEEIIARLDREQAKMTSRFNGWTTVQDGIAFRHDAIEFRRAGSIPYDLHEREFGKEKAVDVKLAVDLIEFSSIYDVAIFVSGDGDYVPAVQAVKDKGKRVVNVSFLTRGGELLPGGARRLNRITDRVCQIPYDEAKRLLLRPA